MSQINFHALEKALQTLEEGLDLKPTSQLEKDGVIQRFEYTFELCWKSIRKILLALGRDEVSSSPKPLFRDALEEGLIQNLDVWFTFIDARNRTSHTYNKQTADQIFNEIKNFPIEARKLLNELNERLKDC